MADAGRMDPSPRPAVPARRRCPGRRPRGRRAGRHGRGRAGRDGRAAARPVRPVAGDLPATLRHPVTRGPRRMQPGRGAGPRLAPRPLWRPPVDPAQAGAFGRPGGVRGSFGPPVTNGIPAARLVSAPPVPEYLEDAFGRPAGNGESLGRRPVDDRTDSGPPEPGDPWRDPDAPVPARTPPEVADRQPGRPPARALHPAPGPVRAPAAAVRADRRCWSPRCWSVRSAR